MRVNATLKLDRDVRFIRDQAETPLVKAGPERIGSEPSRAGCTFEEAFDPTTPLGERHP